MKQPFTLKQKRKWVVRGVVSLLGLFFFIEISAASTSFENFQKGADILRLRHLRYYNELIEKYHQIKGVYPFQNSDPKTPVYVFIANRDQRQFTRPGPPFAHLEIPYKKFITELEKVLETQLDEFYDPQEKPEKKPNFYIYMIRGKSYSLTVHLYNEYPFAKRKTAGYNTVTLSNKSNHITLSILPRRLFDNRVYKKVVQEKLPKKEHFYAVQKKYLHDTKGIFQN